MSNSTSPNFGSIAIEALSLPSKQRAELASRLIRSLESESVPMDDEHLAIVYDRIKKYEAGEITARPTDDVIRELRETYGL